MSYEEQREALVKKYEKMLNRNGDTLTRLLYGAYREASERLFKMIDRLSNLDLSPAQISLLQLICLKGMSVNDLACRMGVSKQAVSRTLGDLVDRGLVRKSVNADDHRSVNIEHTIKGLSLVSLLIDCSISMDKEIVTKLGSKNYLDLKNHLKLLNDLKQNE